MVKKMLIWKPPNNLFNKMKPQIYIYNVKENEFKLKKKKAWCVGLITQAYMLGSFFLYI